MSFTLWPIKAVCWKLTQCLWEFKAGVASTWNVCCHFPFLCLADIANWSQHIFMWDSGFLAQLNEVGALSETCLLSLVHALKCEVRVLKQ